MIQGIVGCATVTLATATGHVAPTSQEGRAATGGALLFGVGYGLALAEGSRTGFERGTEWHAIPLAGPWLVV